MSDSINNGQIQQLVSNLHAIRYESAATLRHDFDGRKVRFIGDCLHGIIAEGTAFTVDEPQSVLSGISLAAGLRSSFDLCREILPGIFNLGLAIGLELGITPVTRLGLRAEMSVRCATSKAVSDSEDLQSRCKGRETMLGPKALFTLPKAVRDQFDREGKIVNLTVERAETLLSRKNAPSGLAAPALGTSSAWAASAEASAAAVRNSGGNRHA
ncbi:hypothetical protein [Rhizobiales bacterium]